MVTDLLGLRVGGCIRAMDEGVAIARASGTEGLSNEWNGDKDAALNVYTRKKKGGSQGPQ